MKLHTLLPLLITTAFTVASCSKPPTGDQSQRITDLEAEIRVLKSQSQGSTDKQKPPGNSPAKQSSAEKADDDEAFSHVTELLLARGDDFFANEKGGQVLPYRTIVQLKDGKFTIAKSPLSEADKLNNITWKGMFYFSCSTYRETELHPLGNAPNWLGWRDATHEGPFYYCFSLARTGQTWSVTTTGADSRKLELIKPTAESIPLPQ